MEQLKRDEFVIVGCEEKDEAMARPSISYLKDAWRRLKQNKIAMLSLWILIIITFLCIFGPYFNGYKFDMQYNELANKKPFGKHWFGMDDLGRDMFVRTWKGGRISIFIGLMGTLIEMVVGSIYGGISGYFGGTVDTIMMRIVEILVGIPWLIVVILFTLVLPRGIFPIIISLCITGWTPLARLVRGQVMLLKESEYVLAANALGASSSRIIRKHLLPNTLGIMIVYMTMDVPAFIFGEAFLSFIGLGVPSPNTSWGAMCESGQQAATFYPHELLFPALAISLTMLAFNLLGDGLRDAFDPKLRQ